MRVFKKDWRLAGVVLLLLTATVGITVKARQQQEYKRRPDSKTPNDSVIMINNREWVNEQALPRVSN